MAKSLHTKAADLVADLAEAFGAMEADKRPLAQRAAFHLSAFLDGLPDEKENASRAAEAMEKISAAADLG